MAFVIQIVHPALRRQRRAQQYPQQQPRAKKNRAMQARIENDYQAEKSGGNNTITTTAVNNSENNYIGKQTAQDVGLQNSLISVVH